MDLIKLIAINYIGLLINGIGALYIMHVLFQRKIQLTKCLLSYLVVFIFISLVGTSVSYLEISRQGYYGAEVTLVLSIFKFGTLVLYYMYLFKSKSVKIIFPGIMLTGAMENIFSKMISLGLTRIEIPISSMDEKEFYFLEVIFVCVATVSFVYIMSKTKLIDYIREFMKDGFGVIPITAFYFVLLNMCEYYYVTAYSSNIERYEVITSGIYIAAFVAFGLIAREFYNKKQLRHLSALLQQQQLYVNRLERIQKELRMLQHDYKNMVAGLYAQADEGNISAVKEYINHKILNIDDGVQHEIRQINQVSQIVNMELKGLFLVKILEAKNAGVEIELEVLYKVQKIVIDIQDLVRCVGILLDNAIEEAQNVKNKRVTVVVLQEGQKTTIIVKNDVSGNVDITHVWENGYSTKGKNRGIGLSNYKKILNQYQNVFCETKVEDKQFVQILVIT